MSQKFLNEIRNIVSTEIKGALNDNNATFAFLDAQHLFEQIELNFEMYKNRKKALDKLGVSYSTADDYYLNMYLQDVKFDTHELLTHPIFNKNSYPNHYWTYLSNFALTADLMFAVQMKMNSIGMDKSIKNIMNVSREINNRITSMWYDVRSYYNNQVEYTYRNRLRLVHAEIIDHITKQRYYYHGEEQDTDDIRSKVFAKRMELINKHLAEFGDSIYINEIYKYTNFSNLSTWRNLFEDDLVGFWTFNHTFNDASKYINNGIPYPNQAYEIGISDYAGSFLTGNYAEVEDDDSLDIGTSDMTITFWVKTTSTKTNNTIITKKSFSSDNGYHLVLYKGRILMQLSNASTSYANYWNSTSAPVNDGNWHMVTVTVDRDSTTGLKIYRDAVLIGTHDPTIRSGSLANSAPLIIGKHITYASCHFSGTIDELRIYKRVLSAEEIQQQYIYPGVY